MKRISAFVFAAFLCLAAALPVQRAQAQNCTGQNANLTLASLAAQPAATVVSPDQTNCTGRGLVVVVDLTTMTSATVTVTIQGKDAASGKYFTLLAGAAQTSTANVVMIVYPGSTASTNVDANYPLPRTWRVSIAVANNSGTAAVTGTVGASVLN